MNRIVTEQEVSSIIFSNDDIIFGTYHLENEMKTGQIYKNNHLICETSGTFQIIETGNSIYSVNNKDIMKISEKVLKIDTDNINTSIYNDVNIFISQSGGSILILDQNFNIQKNIKLCSDHIIWIVKKYDDFLLAGCDCGNFIIYNLKNETKKIIKRNSGVISIHKKNNYFLVGSYDGFLNIYNNDFEEVNKLPLGNVWRIIDIEDNLGLACMYDGVKLIDQNYEIIKTFETKNIAYGIDYDKNRLVFSDFYEKCYYSIEKLF